ncbi:MFS general substrate transporter [Russula earlei]|uniref:MFS general substrate transporter n=1 Tax=Russula earlei TaxID=71964 RepID=A0ACC0UNT0_9AGAM|nr:MFS general substrate transporter [Russula earlei]
MRELETAPGLFSYTRLTALFFSVLVALSSGSNYVVGAYLPQLGARLHLTHTILNVFAVAGNVGVYMSGPIWGKIADTKGPRSLLIVGFISLLSGYSGIHFIFDAGLGNAAELSRFRLAILILCSFITGIGANASMAAAMNTTAKNFPDHLRAMAIGFVMSGFGLSAFFFSSISHILFPGNTSDFLLVLGLGTAIPVIVGLFFVRRIPLPSHVGTAIEVGSSPSYQQLATSPDPDEFQHHDPGPSPPFLSQEDEERESRQPILQQHGPRGHSGISHTSLSDVVELSTSGQFQSLNKPRSMLDPTQATRSRKIVEGRGVDLYRWTLCKSADFWILCTMHTLLAGTGLMYINNVGSIAQALFAHGNPAYDEAKSSAWQAAQVSTLSLANFAGRIVIGIVADTAKSRLRVPRSFCLPLVTTLFILSQLSLLAIGNVRHLWIASGLVGLAYGCWFGLLPTISIEWFGIAHFSENWGIVSIFPVLGANFFSIAFGRNLDAHEPPEYSPMPSNAPPSISARQCLAGRECYVQTLYLNLWACVFVLCLSILAGRRDWLNWQERASGVKSVQWEDEGEVDGLVDSEP